MHPHGIALRRLICSHRRETSISVAPVIAAVALLHTLRLRELADQAPELVEIPF